MSANAAARAATDPRAISPKVKSAGVWGAVATAALVVAGAFLQSVPADALTALGPWAAPVGAAIATLAAVFAAYAKGDPARAPSLYLDAAGGVYTDPGDAEADRFIRGEYASNRVEPQTGHAADPTAETIAAESEAAASELEAQLRATEGGTQ